jgi:hypothetical protein
MGPEEKETLILLQNRLTTYLQAFCVSQRLVTFLRRNFHVQNDMLTISLAKAKHSERLFRALAIGSSAVATSFPS